MSKDLAQVASDFIDGRLSADRFCDEFVRLWKRERDDGRLLLDSPAESESLSTIFCLADLYNPKSDRETYELDEKLLRSKVMAALGR